MEESNSGEVDANHVPKGVNINPVDGAVDIKSADGVVDTKPADGVVDTRPVAEVVDTRPAVVATKPVEEAIVPPPTDGGGETPAAPKRFKFPTALTVLALILGLVWVASFFIPSGRYQLDPKTNRPVPGTYAELP